MNIYALSRRSGITVGKLRGLEKLGVLKVDPENEALERIRIYCRRRTQIPLALLVAMIDDPDMIDDLGSAEQMRHAARQIDALGDLGKGVAPSRVAAAIPDARRGNAVALKSLATWICETLPAAGRVNYHWLALRLLRGAPDAMREQIGGGINTALAHVRGLDGFSNWWHKEDGTIYYQRPVNYDL